MKLQSLVTLLLAGIVGCMPVSQEQTLGKRACYIDPTTCTQHCTTTLPPQNDSSKIISKRTCCTNEESGIEFCSGPEPDQNQGSTTLSKRACWTNRETSEVFCTTPKPPLLSKRQCLIYPNGTQWCSLNPPQESSPQPSPTQTGESTTVSKRQCLIDKDGDQWCSPNPPQLTDAMPPPSRSLTSDEENPTKRQCWINLETGETHCSDNPPDVPSDG